MFLASRTIFSRFEQIDGRLLAALRVLFTRSKKEMEGKTATELSRYKVCNENPNEQNTSLRVPFFSAAFPGKYEVDRSTYSYLFCGSFQSSGSRAGAADPSVGVSMRTGDGSVWVFFRGCAVGR